MLTALSDVTWLVRPGGRCALRFACMLDRVGGGGVSDAKSLRERFADRILYDLLKALVLLLVASSVGTAVAQALAGSVDATRAYRWPIGLGVGAVLLSAMYVGASRLDVRRPRFSRVRSDFLVVNKEIEYIYTDRTNLQYVKRLTLTEIRQ